MGSKSWMASSLRYVPVYNWRLICYFSNLSLKLLTRLYRHPISFCQDELEGDSDASNQIGFLRGSPPVRTSNPVVEDSEFAKLALLSSPPLGSCHGLKPSRHDKGSPSSGSPLGTSPKVRIEGFACGSPESGLVVPAIA